MSRYSYFFQIVIICFFIILIPHVFLFADINPDGSFGTTVLIKLPPGRKGVQPNISLSYNSNEKNGIIGLGWNLSGLPSIERDNSYPINYNSNDHYKGPNGHLIKQDAYYHHVNENYSRFEAVGQQGNGPESWIEYQPDGTKCYYGTTDDSQVYALNNPASIRLWALHSVHDINGYSYEIEYLQDQGQYYPVKIIYTLGDAISKFNVVEFEYDDIRPDVNISYDQSTKVVTRKRLKYITVKCNVTSILGYNLFGDTVRKYQLDYNEDGLINESKLVKIHEFGSNGAELPATEFEYNTLKDPLSFTQKSFLPWSGYNTANGSWLDGDIDGDGDSDLFHICYTSIWNNFIDTLFSNGDGSYSIPNPSYIPGSKYNTSIGQWLNGDFNGDGKTDFFHSFPVLLGQQYINTWLSNGDGTFNVKTFNPGNHYPTSGQWIVADVNGDDRSDMVHLRAKSPICYFDSWISSGDGSFEMKSFQLQDYLNPYAGAILFNYSGIAVPIAAGDFNGDGKDDFTTIWFGESPDYPQVDIATILSNGDGNYNVIHYFPSDSYKITRIASDYVGRPGIQFIVGDHNGDGKSDLILGSTYISKSIILLSIGDGTFEPYVASTDGIGYNLGNWGSFDINSDGKSDIVHYLNNSIYAWLSNGNGNFNIQSYTIPDGDKIHNGLRFPGDADGDLKNDIVNIQNSILNKSINTLKNNLSDSNLLTKIKDGNGGIINIEYQSPFRIGGAIQPSSSSYPYISNTIPRYLATKMTITDGRGSYYWTKYSYHNAKIFTGTNPEKKDLLFERVITVNQSGERTVTEFIQDDYHYHGCPKRVEQYADNGMYIKTVDYQYHENTTTPFDTHISQIKSIIQKNFDNNNVIPISIGEKTYIYDNYGNAIKISDSMTNVETIITINNYAIDESSWILRRLSETSTLSNDIEIKRNKFIYTENNLTSTETYNADSQSWIKQTYGYDSNGNVNIITDPLGHSTTIEYDSDYSSYPVKIINPIGQSVISTYDYRFGTKTSEIDPNGNTIYYEYDDFGRLIKTINPGDEWSTKVVYNITGDPNTQYIETRIADNSKTGFHYKRQYMDALGRVYKIVQKAEETDKVNLEQVVEVVFNEHGQKIKETMPYLTGSYNESPLHIVYKYDSLNRLLSVIYPDHTSKMYSFTHEGNGSYSETLTDRDGTLHTIFRDARGRVIKKIDANIVATSYSYNIAGLLSSLTYTDGQITMINYDTLGRKKSITDPNTGTSYYSYNDAGLLLSSSDALGNTVSYEYDELNRITIIHHPNGTPDVNYFYDDSSVENSKGKITKIIDGVSESTFAYDAKGQTIIKTKKIDGMNFIFKMEYDQVGRVSRLTYPDGTFINRQYADLGYLKNIDWDGFSVVKYGRFKENDDGTIQETGNHVYRVTGNGIETDIEYNPLTTKPERVISRTNNGLGDPIEDHSYIFNVSNLKSVTDNLDNSKSQSFEYDTLNRLVSAYGMYGPVSFNYTTNGNLIQKGDLSLSYNDQSHPYAITGDSEGNSYSYNANGNMISNNGNELNYDGLNRLVSITRNGNNQALYNYDHANHRIKKTLGDGTEVYNIEGLYEITRSPSCPDLHTKYFYGIKNELVSQMTLENPTLLSFNNPSIIGKYYSINNIKGLILYSYEYLNYLSNNQKTFRYFISIMLLFGFIIFLILYINTIITYKISDYHIPKWAMNITPLLCLCIFGLFGCSNMINNYNNNGVPPWIINGDSENPCTPVSGSPIPGMYFFHPDYNRNISYVTNSQGEKIFQAHYKPYGEIAEITGTDVIRYKYNSHQFDQESSFIYYNARYYDPKIGRFITPDTIVPDPGQSQSLNRYMYVVGNPITMNDQSGNSPDNHLQIYSEIMMSNWCQWSEQESQKSLGVQFAKSVINSCTGIFSWIDGGYKGFLSNWITNCINYPGFNLSYSYKQGWGVTGGIHGRYACLSWGNGFHWQEKGPNGGCSIYGTVSLSYDKLSIGLATSYNFDKYTITNNLRLSLNGNYGSLGIGYTWVNNARNGKLLGGGMTAYGGINVSNIIGAIPTSNKTVDKEIHNNNEELGQYDRYMPIKFWQPGDNSVFGTQDDGPASEKSIGCQIASILGFQPTAIVHDNLVVVAGWSKNDPMFWLSMPIGFILGTPIALAEMSYQYNYTKWFMGY